MKILSITFLVVFLFVGNIFSVNASYEPYNEGWVFYALSGTSPDNCTVTKTPSYWEIELTNQSLSGGCHIGRQYGIYPTGLSSTMPWSVTYEVVYNNYCLVKFGTNNGAGFPNASPVNIQLDTLTPGVIYTSNFSFTALNLSQMGWGINRNAGTASCAVKVYSIADSTGRIVWSPSVSGDSSGSSSGGATSVVFPDPFIVQGVNDDLQNFALLLQIFVIIFLSIIYVFKPFIYHDRK